MQDDSKCEIFCLSELELSMPCASMTSMPCAMQGMQACLELRHASELELSMPCASSASMPCAN